MSVYVGPNGQYEYNNNADRYSVKAIPGECSIFQCSIFSSLILSFVALMVYFDEIILLTVRLSLMNLGVPVGIYFIKELLTHE